MNVDGKKSLEVTKLCASWNNKSVLENVSVKVEAGKIVCVCGSNGAGKSTFLKAVIGSKCAGLKIIAEKGPVINHKKIDNLSPLEKARLFGVLWQNEGTVFDYKVADVLLTGRYCRCKIPGIYSKNDRKIVKEVAEKLEIGNLLEKSIFELSGGEFQKVRIGRCLCQEPDFLILDEPFANLDMVSEGNLIEILKNLALNKNLGILISVHNLNTAAELGDSFILLGKNCGKLISSGSKEQVFTKKNLSLAYGGNWENINKVLWKVN